MQTGSIGTAGTNRPRAKVSEYDIALKLVTAFGGSDEVKKHLTELRNGTASYDRARELSEEAAADAVRRKTEAEAAESGATRARQGLADEQATATQRDSDMAATLDTEKRRLTDWAVDLDIQRKDLEAALAPARRLVEPLAAFADMTIEVSSL